MTCGYFAYQGYVGQAKIRKQYFGKNRVLQQQCGLQP